MAPAEAPVTGAPWERKRHQSGVILKEQLDVTRQCFAVPIPQIIPGAERSACQLVGWSTELRQTLVHSTNDRSYVTSKLQRESQCEVNALEGVEGMRW